MLGDEAFYYSNEWGGVTRCSMCTQWDDFVIAKNADISFEIHFATITTDSLSFVLKKSFLVRFMSCGQFLTLYGGRVPPTLLQASFSR